MLCIGHKRKLRDCKAKKEKIMENKTWMELSAEELEILAYSVTCMYGKEGGEII